MFRIKILQSIYINFQCSNLASIFIKALSKFQAARIVICGKKNLDFTIG